MQSSSSNLCPAGQQGLNCFLLSALVFTLSYFTGSYFGSTSQLWGLTLWGPALYFCLFNFFLKYLYRGFLYEVSIRSTFLGCTLATGLFLAVTFDNGIRVFGLYIMVMSAFHFSEFYTIALSNPATLSVDSFILNHSVQYGMAAVASWTEWAVEFYFLPGMKEYFWLSFVGLVLCVGGEVLRKGAMITAKTNFNHTVQFVKRPEHVLVTHGLYAWCRHPSYVGWFYWSIGTQIILLNPVCVLVYALASWSFFRARVFEEEVTLCAFFGDQYRAYQRRVRTGLPLIHGYIDDDSH